MKTYLKILSLFPLLVLATTVLAAENPDELYRQGKFAEAEEAYSRLDMENPKDIRYRYNRGCAAYQNSDFQTALAAFTSVLRRTDDKKIKAKTVYNLGNTAFKQGNYDSAVKYFSQAVQLDPDNEDAPYNFELALRELEKQKAKEKKEKQSRKNSEDKGEEKDGSEDDKKDKESEKQSSDQRKYSNEKQQKSDVEKNNGKGDRQSEEQEKPEDLSGELESSQTMPEKKEDTPERQSGEMFDRNKAEALLDNLKEDRSKFMRFNIPKDKMEGVGSGKDW